MDCRVQQVKKNLEGYPFLKFCFEKYINWVFTKSTAADITKFPLINILLKNEQNFAGAQELEDKLQNVLKIMNVNKEEFRRIFRFQDALLTDEIEEVHNILAEPLFVLDLHNYKFKKVEKPSLASSRKSNRLKLADFTATHGDDKFAIELKTTAMEKDVENGKLLSGGHKEARNMLLENCLTKIEESGYKVFEQLDNTHRLFHCTKKMVVFYNRRLRVLAYLEKQDFIDVASDVFSKYSSYFDYVAIKNYNASEVLFYPVLNVVSGATPDA